jgi:23S rRNA (guanine745-N1)-methyltransferase
LDALRGTLAAALEGTAHAHSRLLDVGCGEGSVTAGLVQQLGLEGWGTDISVPAIDLAARSFPSLHWIVANADRRLPFADGAFSVVTSVTARKNGSEIARLLAPDGRAVVVVAAPDDLHELRAQLAGAATEKDRVSATIAALAPWLELESDREARLTRKLDAAGLGDVLAATYRGGRHREQARLEGVPGLSVTVSHRVLVFRHREVG